jgi:hypothetical protein
MSLLQHHTIISLTPRVLIHNSTAAADSHHITCIISMTRNQTPFADQDREFAALLVRPLLKSSV